MARFISLGAFSVLFGALGFSGTLFSPLAADTPMMEMTGAAPAPPTSAAAPGSPAIGATVAAAAPVAATQPASSPANTAAPKPVLPSPPSDDFVRYGKILSPNDQPPYPFKLTMPSPGFGELKVPSQGELAMREKLERLATLSDSETRAQLEQWPAFSKMSLGDQGAMLTRIQQFRDRRSKMAQIKRAQLGLSTLNPQQQARFEQEYWDKRVQMDHQLSQQFQPTVKAAEQKLNEDLFREFSSPAKVAQALKPPASAGTGVAVNKPPPPIKSAPIVTTP